MSKEVKLYSGEFSLDEIEKVAGQLVKHISKGDVLLFYGPIGSGKTTFIRVMLKLMGFPHPELVNSPTYTLVNIYNWGENVVFHIDLYRLDNLKDAFSFEFLDYIYDMNSIKMVEWADKAQPIFADLEGFDILVFRFKVVGELQRYLEVYKYYGEGR